MDGSTLEPRGCCRTSFKATTSKKLLVQAMSCPTRPPSYKKKLARLKLLKECFSATTASTSDSVTHCSYIVDDAPAEAEEEEEEEIEERHSDLEKMETPSRENQRQRWMERYHMIREQTKANSRNAITPNAMPRMATPHRPTTKAIQQRSPANLLDEWHHQACQWVCEIQEEDVRGF